ncbi:MAG: ATP-binding protein [Candidatus Woesearchaeota archaeon]
MIPKDVLSHIVQKQQQFLCLDIGIKREVSLTPLSKFAYILTGVRRCGKSTLLKQYFQDKKVHYILFEDINLNNFQTEDFNKLDAIFAEQHNTNIYFLDEVQNVKGWEIYVRQLLDAGKEVFITGSNATLMSKELGTRLTGRNIKQELFPFSFSEFCVMEKKSPSLNTFESYMQLGGMPEYLRTKDERVLQGLVEDVLYKDVIIRRNIREQKVARQIVLHILSGIGKPFSYSQLQKLLGNVSINTIIDIIDALEQAYFVYIVNKFDFSLKKQSRNYKKAYVIDTGLAKSVAFQASPDYGRYLENIVFLQLRRKGKEVYYHKDIYECDFVIKQGLNITQAIQVCYQIHDDNRKRELDGLVQACKTYKLNNGLLLSYNQQDSFVVDNIHIQVKPVWKWLLEV